MGAPRSLREKGVGFGFSGFSDDLEPEAKWDEFKDIKWVRTFEKRVGERERGGQRDWACDLWTSVDKVDLRGWQIMEGLMAA